MPVLSIGSVLRRRELPHLTKNPTNPLAYTMDVFNCVMFSVAAFVVFLRLLARRKIRSFGKDDFFIICTLAWFFISCLTGVAMHKVYDGGSTTTTFRNTELYLYWFLVAEVSYAWTMVFLKLSLGYFFLRLLVTPAQRRTVYTVMYFAVCLNIALSIFDIFQCGNPHDYPLKIQLEKGCASQEVQKATAWIQAVFNAMTDLTFAIVPFWLLNNSMLPKNLKLYVIGILGLATIGCVASFVRMAYIDNLFNLADFTIAIEQLSIASTVEMGTGIIASSLATLRPLIASSLDNLTSKLSGTLSSFGSTPRRQPNSLAASSALRTEHSLVEAEARYGTKKQAVKAHHVLQQQQQPQHHPSQDELVREEVLFSPDATHTSFLTDESDHEARWNNGHPPRRPGDAGARGPMIQEVELAHIKSGADAYHTWK